MTKGATILNILFRVTMTGKIVYGTLRLILGFALLRLVGSPFSDIFYTLLSHELITDPNDILLQAVMPLLKYLAFPVTYFIAFYILFWGFLDIFLGISLLKDKIWAFPTSLILIGVFVIYEIYRFFHTHSVILACIIVIDLILMWLIYKEYLRITSVQTLNKIA